MRASGRRVASSHGFLGLPCWRACLAYRLYWLFALAHLSAQRATAGQEAVRRYGSQRNGPLSSLIAKPVAAGAVSLLQVAEQLGLACRFNLWGRNTPTDSQVDNHLPLAQCAGAAARDSNWRGSWQRLARSCGRMPAPVRKFANERDGMPGCPERTPTNH